MTREILRKQIENSMRIREVFGREVYPEVVVEEEDLRRYFGTHAEEFATTAADKLREVVVLYYLEGRSVAEAAQALNCSESAVKKRLERARPQLRMYFEAHWQAELERERGDS